MPDVDECGSRSHGCQHYCVNNDGGYKCSCMEGFELATDGRTCQGLRHTFLSSLTLVVLHLQIFMTSSLVVVIAFRRERVCVAQWRLRTSLCQLWRRFQVSVWTGIRTSTRRQILLRYSHLSPQPHFLSYVVKLRFFRYWRVFDKQWRMRSNLSKRRRIFRVFVSTWIYADIQSTRVHRFLWRHTLMLLCMPSFELLHLTSQMWTSAWLITEDANSFVSTLSEVFTVNVLKDSNFSKMDATANVKHYPPLLPVSYELKIVCFQNRKESQSLFLIIMFFLLKD